MAEKRENKQRRRTTEGGGEKREKAMVEIKGDKWGRAGAGKGGDKQGGLWLRE